MLKVTKTALVVSALTLGSMSVANAYHATNVTSSGSVQVFTQVEDVTTFRSLANYAAIYNVGLDVNQSTVDIVNARALSSNRNTELWLTPTYSKSSRSFTTKYDGNYDVDISLTGLNVGFERADFEQSTQNGWAYGALFNFGKASTDGEGRARYTENDADYFSFGAYGKMAFDNLKLTLDMVLSKVNNELEGTLISNPNLNKVKSDVDTYVVSLGLSGYYTFNTSFADITPHLALRYTSLELDGTNYNVNTTRGVIANNSVDTVDVFSVPFGVTVSKSIQAGDWNLAPKFDVTFTSNFGDDKYRYTSKVVNFYTGLRNYTEEQKFLDSFTYGATLGLDAKYKDHLDLGVGVGYTGASNSDKFNVTANVGYRF